jgi:hypothetical protein
MVRLRLTLSVAALGRFCLYDGAISAMRSGATDSVDRISSVDPFASDGISALAQPSERRPRRVRQPARRFDQGRDSRATMPLQQFDQPPGSPMAMDGTARDPLSIEAVTGAKTDRIKVVG